MLLRSFATAVVMLGAASAQGAEGLQGAWQLQSGEFVDPQGTVVDYAS